MSLPSIPERVAAGVAWLDEHVGPEWVDRIVLDEFWINDRCKCVLGFVYADKAESIPRVDGKPSGFGHGLSLLGTEQVEALGFDAGLEDSCAAYSILQAEWRKVIAERQASR